MKTGIPARILNILLTSYVFLLFALFIVFSSTAHSGEFKLIKTDGGRYVPEPREPGVTLPGTNIKAGLFWYIFEENYESGKLGFLINEARFYFLQSHRPPDEGEYQLVGLSTFGIYKKYFLFESSSGGTTRNNNLFLFQYDENSIHLSDVIVRCSMDFISSIQQTTQEKTEYGAFEDHLYPVWRFRKPVWMEIDDIDSDGNPEIKLIISYAFRFEPYFKLYIEISEGKLKVDFNPMLYKAFFEQEKGKSQTESKTDQYYIYAFLSKALSLTEIEDTLKSDRKDLISFLKQMEVLDQELHELGIGEKFSIEEYNLRKE